MTAERDNLPPILPVGTAVVMRGPVRAGGAVVCPAGAVGTILQAPGDPDHAYRVQLPGGEKVSLRRSELAVLKHFQADGLARAQHPMAEHDLWQYVIYRCVVGSRAYGLDHAGSDVDRRGVYLPPAEMHWSLAGVPEQLENTDTEECYWELQKFLTLALKANPNVLEVLYTPLVVHTTPQHEELEALGGACITRHHAHHYLGFARNQWDLLAKKGPPRVKPLLYVYRVLLTGIHLMRTGRVEANLRALNDARGPGRLPYVDKLIERKTAGGERGLLAGADVAFHESEYQRLTAELEQARDSSALPEAPSAKDGLHDLLLRVREGMRSDGA